MKKDIHPKYYPEAKVICACGNTWITGSTQEVIRTEMCSACHPFFTGEQRIVDTAGQVDRFQRRKEKSALIAEEAARRRLAKEEKEAESLFEFVNEEKLEGTALPEAQPVVGRPVAAATEKPKGKRSASQKQVGRVKGVPQTARPKRTAKAAQRPKGETGHPRRSESTAEAAE